MNWLTNTYITPFLDDSIENKLDLLRLILQVDTTLLIAVVSVSFVVYQLDKYKKFKQFNYLHLSLYAGLSSLIGVVMPLILLQKTAGSYNFFESIIYIVSVLSPLILLMASTIYLWKVISSLNTEALINSFHYESKERSREDKQNPLALQAEEICKWHGSVMQERYSTHISQLVNKDDLLVRMAITAIAENDTLTLKYIIKRYAALLKGTSSYEAASFYEADLKEIVEQVVFVKKDKLYEYIIDELSINWLGNKNTLNEIPDHIGEIYTGLLFKYVNLGNDFNVTQKASSLLVTFHFLVINSTSEKRDWLQTLHLLQIHIKESIVKIAQKGQEFNLWLMHEKVRYYANHGGETKDIDLMENYMKFMYITGITGKVYNLRCGGSNCSKSIYEHAVEDLEELYAWRETFNKKQKKQFDLSYKEALEKLIGYEVEFKRNKNEYTTNKEKPKQVHSVTLGPSKSTSDSNIIDYSSITPQQLERLVFNHVRVF